MSISPGLYFFNDQYDAKIIDSYIFKLKNNLFYRSLEAQNTIDTLMKTNTTYYMTDSPGFFLTADGAKIKIVEEEPLTKISTLHGTMSDFIVDPILNNKYGFSAGTVSFKLDGTDIIPFYNKKENINKYNYNTPLTLIDIINDYKTFSKRLIFTIDKYMFLKLKVVPIIGGTILVIHDDVEEGISASRLNTFISQNKDWSLVVENHSDFYSTYKINSSLFSTGKNSISMNQILQKIEFPKPNKINSYNIAISASTSETNLLAQSTAKLELDTDGITKCFTISAAFKNYIMTNSNNCKCYIFNTYKKTGFGIINNLPNDPKIMMQIPYTNNPISTKNINIWTYDSVNDIKLTRVKNNLTQGYPNIYDLSSLTRGLTYYIDWYSVDINQIQFDNNIKDYIDCYPSTYVNMILNKTAPQVLLDYRPISEFNYNYDDFILKNLSGDIREYKMIKLKELLADDGNRFLNMIKKINIKNRKSIYAYYDMSIDTNIYNRSVMSNSGQIIGNNIVNFSSANTYIIISNSNGSNKNAMVFVNGKKIIPTLVCTQNYKTYIYIQKSLLTSTSKIIIDVPLIDADMNKSNAEFTLSEVGMGVAFPRPELFKNISSLNLLFYDTSTNEYFDTDFLNFFLKVKTATIKSDKEDLKLFYSSQQDIEFLVTGFLEFILTPSGERLQPKKDISEVRVPDSGITTIATSDLSVFNTISQYPFEITESDTLIDSPMIFNKEINSKDLLIFTDYTELLNKSISVTNTNNYKYISIPNIATSPIGTFTSFKEDPSPERFRVFINGILANNDQYTYTPPSKYNENAVFQITSYVPIQGVNSALIEYLPNKETTILNSVISNIGSIGGIVYNNSLFDLTPFATNPFDKDIAKFYINGIRIPNENVIETKYVNVIKIKGLLSTDRLRIDVPNCDGDCYGYKDIKSNLLFNKLLETDSTFRTYFNNKY